MIDQSFFQPDVEDSLKEEIAKRKISEVEDRFDLEISGEVDQVSYDPSLSYQGAVAQTRVKPAGDIELAFGEHFFDPSVPEYLRDVRQERTVLHELLHVSDFTDRIEEDLEYLGAPDDFIQEWSSSPFHRPVSETEALTEIAVDELLEEDIGSGYPYEKRRKERELERRGVDTEFGDAGSGLVEDIQEEIDGIFDYQKEVYDSFETGNVYMESGEFEDFQYTAVVVGYDDPGEKVNEYLEEVEGIYNSYSNEEEVGAEAGEPAPGNDLSTAGV